MATGIIFGDERRGTFGSWIWAKVFARLALVEPAGGVPEIRRDGSR
jgi:hypothetical protein